MIDILILAEVVGIEPTFSRLELDVLPLDETPNSYSLILLKIKELVNSTTNLEVHQSKLVSSYLTYLS